MTHCITKTRQPARAGGPIHEDRIEGGFIKLTTHQLILAYWLYRAGHICRRQLRIWFAAAEMKRRREACQDSGQQPVYGLGELSRLVGGAGSPRALRALQSDVNHLKRLGLVTIAEHEITFAVSIDQITLEDVSGFWAMFEQIPNERRSVPVPRRTVRALAGGFDRATTALMIALVIRGVFWHKDQARFRTDHRTKLSWVAEVFQISRRALTDARAKLIGLGWLAPIETAHWERQHFGCHDRIITDANLRAGQGGDSDSASRNAVSDSDSASPYKQNPSSYEESNKQKLSREPSARHDRSGVSIRNKGLDRSTPHQEPMLRDVQQFDLDDNERLLELYRQAIAAGRAGKGEAGKLEFFSLAERARAQGKRPGALFTWLLTNRRTDFITQADEEGAARRLRELRDGPCLRENADPAYTVRRVQPRELTEEERFIAACLKVGQQNRCEPYLIARQAKNWTRDEWDERRFAFDQAQRERWSPDRQDHF